MVAAGLQHTIALKSDGTVWSWGQNDAGQLGDNTTNNTDTPIQVHGAGNVGFLTGVKAIAAAAGHSMALKADGTVWQWGAFYSVSELVPAQVSGLTDVVAIAGGDDQSMALKADGTVWTWGDNTYGQLGDGNSPTGSTSPVQVSGLTDVKAIAGGALSDFALKTDGTVWSWGINIAGALGDGTTTDRDTPVQVTGLTDVKAIGGSRAIKADGTLWAWGGNSWGELGINTTDGSNHTSPVQVHGVGNVGFLTDIVAISGFQGFFGGHKNFALKADGTMYSWGYNGSGDLGDGSFTSRSVPVQVHGVGDVGFLAGVIQVSQLSALKADGSVYKWGDNENGYIGDGTTNSSNVPVASSINLYVSPKGVIDAQGGQDFSLALRANGTVWAWGYGGDGNHGDGTTTDTNSPVQSTITDVVRIAAGGDHALAIKSDGSVWTWGSSSNGQVGNGSLSNATTPVSIGLTDVTAVAGGYYHSLALKADGTVWSWGYNLYGQLGDGSNTDTNTPNQVPGLSGIVAISAGSQQSYALKYDGTVWAWGFNAGGQLGNGNSPTNSNVPVQVSGITDAREIAGGGGFAMVLKSDGTIVAWGVNAFGALGDGTNTSSDVPVAVSTGDLGNGAVTIAAGDEHALATRTDGTLWAWGANGNGELGDGSNTDRNVPVQVSGLSNVKVIARGFIHSFAIKADGSLWTWGFNTDGELGNGSNSDSNVPVTVSFPAPPAGPSPNTTDNSVTLSRIAVNATATATIHFVLNSTLSSQLTVTFDPAFTGLDVGSASALTPSAPGCVTNFNATGGNTFTADKASCTGEVIITGVTVVNPPTPGGYLVSWTNDDAGYAMVAIADDDQVTVDATVDPTITFDLNANTDNAPQSAPYSVALGALTIGAVNHSDNSTVNSIWANLDTNATGGAIVTVLSQNAALASLSVPTDTIPNAANPMAAGTANYGLCVNSVTGPTAANGTFQASAPYNAGTCDPAGSTNDVQALDTVTPTPVLDSGAGPVTTGSAEILVNAAISTTTVAHSDYADVLTFVATGTF